MRIRFIATPTSLMLPRGESWSEGDVADLPRDQAQRWIGLDVAVEAPPEYATDVADILAEANPAPDTGDGSQADGAAASAKPLAATPGARKPKG